MTKTYNEHEVFSALCVWEHILENRDDYESYVDQFGTATMRYAASIAGAFIEKVHETLQAQHYECNKPFDWEVVPALCRMLEWESIIRNAVYGTEWNPDPALYAGRLLAEHPELYWYDDPKERWMNEARTAAHRLYCYRDLVDEHIDKAERAYAAGETATEFVQWFGEKYDLIPASSLRTF